MVLISNLKLHDAGLLGAFNSRVHVHNYDPTDAQLGAVMLGLADRGWPFRAQIQTVLPAEGRVVAEFLNGEMARQGVRFDLRLLVHKALPDYQQWKDGDAESDWKDLVAAAVAEHLVETTHTTDAAPRADRKAVEQEIVRWILEKHPSREDRVRAWVEKTGKSERAFYRRRAEVETS